MREFKSSRITVRSEDAIFVEHDRSVACEKRGRWVYVFMSTHETGQRNKLRIFKKKKKDIRVKGTRGFGSVTSLFLARKV